MKSTPSLSTSNHFEILSNICDFETALPDVQTSEKSISIPISILKVQKSKWEKALPKKYHIATAGQSLHSLKLKVKIETIDTSERRSVTCLVESGATSEFIDQDYAKSCRFNLVKLKQPIPVYNVDGTPNEAGSISEVVHLILHHNNHSERTTFAITCLGKQKLLLRHSWLLLGDRLIGIPIPVRLYDELSTLDYTLLYIVYIYRSLFPTHVAASRAMCSLSLLGSCSKPTSVEDPYLGPLYISCSTCTTLTPMYVLAIRR